MTLGIAHRRPGAALILTLLLGAPSAGSADENASPPSSAPDTPAGPKRLSGPPLRFPSGSHQSFEGWVDIDCNVDEEGHTSLCVVAGRAGDRSFAESALDYVATGVYSPATRGGVPVPEPHHRFHLSYKLSD